jgi:hypothetical protein
MEDSGDQLSLQSLDLNPHLHPGLAVESRKRFIQEEDVRLDGKRPGQGDPLLLPSRKTHWVSVEELLDTEQ